MSIKKIVFPKRECDSCTQCCQGWLWGEAYGKTFFPGKPCHFVGSSGCKIYKDRPKDPCVSFRCSWLENPEMFPEWLKPSLSKLIAVTSKTQNGILYYKIYECGQKIDSSVLNYLVLHALQNGVNMNIQVGGGWSNYGTQEFINDVNN